MVGEFMCDKVDQSRPDMFLRIACARSIERQGFRWSTLVDPCWPTDRRSFEQAARDLARQGLTARDIGEAFRLGTAAAAALLEAGHVQ